MHASPLLSFHMTMPRVRPCKCSEVPTADAGSQQGSAKPCSRPTLLETQNVILCAGSMAGAELAPLLTVLRLEDGDVKEASAYLSLQDRLKVLRKWVDTGSTH